MNVFNGTSEQYFLNKLSVAMSSKLAPLQVFTKKVEPNPIAPRSTVIVPVGSSTSATVVNPTDYETGTTNFTGSTVVVNEYCQTWMLSNEDIQKGISFSTLDEMHVNTFVNTLNDAVLNTISSSNFATASCNLTVSASAFSTTQLKLLRQDLSNYDKKYVLLDGMCYSQFIGVNLQSYDLKQGNSIYGFDGFYENGRLDKCGTPCNAVVCSPNAILLATGKPIMNYADMNAMISVSEISVPGIDIPVILEQWYSTKTRSAHRALRTMFGVGVGDKSALRYFKGL